MKLNIKEIQGLVESIAKFIVWLNKKGDYSYDPYDFWATTTGQKAKQFYHKKNKSGLISVAPFVFLDTFFPSTRRFVQKPQRYPIADAHYAMGFLFLHFLTQKKYFYNRALQFINSLKNSVTTSNNYFGWGYPFDWMTQNDIVKNGTPLITNIPYIFEAFASIYKVDNDDRWLETMFSIAEHAARDYNGIELDSDTQICSYTPNENIHSIRHVVNANAYRAYLLLHAFKYFKKLEYQETAYKNLNFVLQSQQQNGAWLYATDGSDSFIDHIHTCFVLKNLMKIDQIAGTKNCREAIEKGLVYYKRHLLNGSGLPKPFAKAQRAVMYKKELYDYAESINLGILAVDYSSEFKFDIIQILADLLVRWQKPDGSFKTRQLYLGWNKIPYHRWGHSQLFRSLINLAFTQREAIRQNNLEKILCAE